MCLSHRSRKNSTFEINHGTTPEIMLQNPERLGREQQKTMEVRGNYPNFKQQ